MLWHTIIVSFLEFDHTENGNEENIWNDIIISDNDKIVVDEDNDENKFLENLFGFIQFCSNIFNFTSF